MRRWDVYSWSSSWRCLVRWRPDCLERLERLRSLGLRSLGMRSLRLLSLMLLLLFLGRLCLLALLWLRRGEALACVWDPLMAD